MKRSLKWFWVLISFIFFVPAGLIFAQGTWSVVTKPDFDKSISDLFFLSDSLTGWFIGDGGLILKTTDGGITRITQTSGTTKDLNRIVFINDSTGWIVGEDGAILKTTNGGVTWNLQTPPDATADFNDIAVGSETHAIAVADGGKIVATNDGVTWVAQTSGTVNALYGVSCFGVNAAIAVGQKETIVRTTDWGTTWKPATTIAPIQAKDYNAIKMVSEKKAWLVGDGFKTLSLKCVFASTEDGGDNWALYLPIEEAFENMWDIDFTNDTTGIAVGDRGMVFTTTNGKNWKQAPPGFGFDGHSISVVGNHAWVCRFETLVKTEDFAQTWKLLMTISGHHLYDIATLDEGHTIAIGFDASKLETRDGGYTWKSGYITADNDVNRYDGIYFLNPTIGWIVGVGGFVAKTEDAGITWHKRNSGIGDTWLRDIYFVNDSTGWAVGASGKVFKTMDSGTTWTLQSGIPNKTLYALWMFDKNNGVLGGADKTVYYTIDGGTVWKTATTIPVGTTDDINGFYFISPTQGWAVGEKGAIIMTIDAGLNWTKQTSGVTVELEDVYFRNATDGWVVGEGGLILATTNGGTSWAPQAAGLTANKLYGIVAKNNSILWAAGEKGTILKYVDNNYVAHSNLKLNEIFYNAFRSTELECQFLEIYNAGSETEYLDGKILCRLNDDINDITYIWQFPGTGTDFPMLPGEYKIVTPDAKAYTDLNLSGANFEFYIAGEFKPYDNPDVPNLINIRSLSDPNHKSEFLISYASDEVLLASGKDLHWQDGIDIETVIDGVEYDKSATGNKTVNSLVDAGHIIGPGSNYQGRSVERKTPGQDTNNSTEDFRMIKAPTPWKSAPNYKIAGAVNYYSNDKSVARATINLGGYTNLTTPTGTDGLFLFEDLDDADFMLTADKIGDLGQAIDPYDAALILQSIVGSVTLSPVQKIAADVTKNGEVTAFDASFILRKYVGAITEFPTKREWAFIPKNFILDGTNWSQAPGFFEYKPLKSDMPDQNFMALAYGDVSGNWGATQLAKTLGSVNIDIIPEAQSGGKTTSFAIKMEQANLVISGGFEINFDESAYRVIAIRAGEILGGSGFASAVNHGTIAFAFASAHPIQNDGVVATIDLEVLQNKTASAESFEFSHISLNEGAIKIEVNGKPFGMDVTIPDRFALKQNYPNPFNPVTSIAFDLPTDAKVTIKVFDLLGHEVATLIDKPMKAGSHSIQYEVINLTSGVYFYQIKATDFNAVRKMILLK